LAPDRASKSRTEGYLLWEACTPDLSVCTPFPTGPELNTAVAAPETVFRFNKKCSCEARSPSGTIDQEPIAGGAAFEDVVPDLGTVLTAFSLPRAISTSVTLKDT
jgi:hypothetical protein